MERQHAHQLLDQLGKREFAAVARLLEILAAKDGAEPLAHSLAQAPVEEEEITPETAEALTRPRASLARGEGVPHADVLREFGQTR